MAVFVCAGCDAVLTAEVSQVALPAEVHQRWGNGVLLPVLMAAGTYAVEPEPSGPPWRSWSEVGPEEAEKRGVYAPVFALSFGAPGAVFVAPGDTRGTVLIPERCGGFCCGLDGRDGPNLACERCGRAVATRIDDCSYWQSVRLDPQAVRGLPAPGPTTGSGPREGREREGASPVDPYGGRSPRWEAAAGVALAHLLVASEGRAVAVPDGLAAELFRHALDTLLPTGRPAKRVALAGPGLPAPDAGVDIVLVPPRPWTGRAWQPPGTAAVPMTADIWSQLTCPHRELPVPVTGGMPDGVFRDDPLPLHPRRLFRPDWGVFLHTLARLPAVREPWLRALHDHVRSRPYADPF
ncbi:hypothetical protein [Streptomyces canus]|uniref:hypothetical protein n=1 Tax=Streptomyces canus TaxID=58343 RepID=UPI002E282E28|nr:hypothetical protein [Streptomyces canus]